VHLHETVDVPHDATRTAHLLADPAVARAVGSRAGALTQQVEVTGSADAAFTVAARRTLGTDAIPTHLRGFVGSSIEVHQVEAWEAPAGDGSRAGSVTVEVVGAPVRLTGRASLLAAGADSCRLVYDGDLRASIPLFGRAVEGAVADAVRGALRAEADELASRG
jgi:hypothetical protein